MPSGRTNLGLLLLAVAASTGTLPGVNSAGGSSMSVAVQNLVRSAYFRNPVPHVDAALQSLKALQEQKAAASFGRGGGSNSSGNTPTAGGLYGGAVPAAATVANATADADAAAPPQPFLTIQFGPAEMTVPEGSYRDAGTPYARHDALGVSWGWNCDLDKLQSLRMRDVGEPQVLRGFVIPDRQGTCSRAPIWSISLPEGEYTIKIRSVGRSSVVDRLLLCCRRILFVALRIHTSHA
jgi:hypothetical protein